MKIRSRWAAWVGAGLAVGLAKALFLTCRKVYLAPRNNWSLGHVPTDNDQEWFLLSVWHDELLVPTFASAPGLRKKTCCLVSRHQDGSYLANAMAMLGYSTVRGSSRRGGAQAVRQLLEETAGKHIVFTPDGPCGPRRQLKPGIVYVASQLGRRIIPGAYGASHCWRMQGRWTDLLIPKPFSTIYVVSGDPISIPLELSSDQLEEYVQRVQIAMEELNDRVARIGRGEPEIIPALSELSSSPRKAA